MPADIAHGQRAIDRIGQRMHADIGIGMADQPAIMVDADAAQPDVIARPGGMHVKAVAHADIHGVPQNAFGPREIGGIGDFQIVFVLSLIHI